MSGSWWVEINGKMPGGLMLLEYRKMEFAAREPLKT
jgi:hypothetical protein